MINFKDKKILITGAAGGIGNALVKKFNSLNGKVLATGTKIEKLNDLKKQFPEVEILKCDLSEHSIIEEFIVDYEKLSSLSKETIEPIVKSLINKHKTNFKGVGQPLRIALVGSRFGPGLYDVILSLNKTEVIKRLSKIK